MNDSGTLAHTQGQLLWLAASVIWKRCTPWDELPGSLRPSLECWSASAMTREFRRAVTSILNYTRQRIQ
jgi:hypothetical protein